MELTAAQVVERIHKNVGDWKESEADTFVIGSPDTVVTGIVTTWTPTLDVLRKAVAERRNLIISRENPFWDRGQRIKGYSGGGAVTKKEVIEADPTYHYKRDYIEKNKLVVYRLFDNWDARRANLEVDGLVKALGWDKSPRKGRVVTLKETSLDQLARDVREKLNIKGIRVLGKPDTKVSRAAITLGFLQVPELRNVVSDSSVDVVICGEPVEWEAGPYFHDLVYSGQKKGMLIIGQEASEEPGSREMAAWIKTFVTETPVDFIAAGEPFWVPKKA